MLLCIHIASFGLAIARRDRLDIAIDHCALLADKADRGHVIELDERAHALGARIGQTVLQARASAAEAAVLVHDAVRSREAWHDMLDALDTVSPLVDDSAEGTAYLDMRGIEGHPREWLARAQRAVAHFDLPVRVAVGPNKFAARAATYVANECICSGGEAAMLLAPLRIEILDFDPRTVERLHLLGVRTLGELARLPHGPFVRRFGKEASVWHEWAHGIDRTPFRPRAHELLIGAAVYGEGSAAQEEQVCFALRALAERVCSDLTRTGKGAAMLRVTFECENNDLRTLDVGFAQPTGDARMMLDVVRAKLEGARFDAPITGLRLQAIQLEECGSSATLFGQQDADPQAVAVALARLEAALGNHPQRARVRTAPRLEAQFSYDPFTVAVHRAPADAMPVARAIPQLRLLTVREIDVRMRGNAPAAVGSRAVLDCAGPWRVDDGWFATPIVRDEYDVLLEDGMLCRIYRQGECWYLRGAYD